MQANSFSNEKDRLILLAGGLFGTVSLLMLWRFDPVSSGAFPPCPFHALTGLYCPGCGSLRALHQLLHGNLWVAFAMNPLAMIALPFLMYGVVSWIFLQLGGRGLPQFFIPGRWILVLALLFIAYGVARNIPFSPFALLAPGGLLQL